MLELLPPDDVNRDLYLGRVYNRHGRECVDWRTVHGRRKVIIRGSKEAHFRTCGECGRNIYFATGKRYLSPRPPDDATIFGSDLSGLVVPLSSAERIRAKRWRKVSIETLPVLEVPSDGFGLLPYREPTS
jgi:hypothetical protein